MFLFYLFAVALVFLSYKSLRGGFDYLNFFKRETAKPESDFAPFVTVIVPCRGLDDDLEKNLAAFGKQKFPAYEILFVIDDERDEAVKIIEKVLREAAANVNIRLIIAGKAAGESQKVHNLREAVLQISDEAKIFVFADSDARPAENWLKNLIAPLVDKSIGAASGYRWFVSKKATFASEMRSVWNASIASALGANTKSNFCWGGSMAIRRETFENLNMRERWRGTLSDDFAVTRAMKENGLPIYFVPRAMTASIENCTFGELLEFTTRQMKITRVYAPHLWKASLMGAFLFNLVFVWGILIVVFRPDSDVFLFWFALVSLILIAAFSTGKSWLRLNAVKLILRDYEPQLKSQFWTQNTLWILSPALFLYNSIGALFSRKIIWRGIAYELKSARETVIIPLDDATRT